MIWPQASGINALSLKSFVVCKKKFTAFEKFLFKVPKDFISSWFGRLNIQMALKKLSESVKERFAIIIMSF